MLSGVEASLQSVVVRLWKKIRIRHRFSDADKGGMGKPGTEVPGGSGKMKRAPKESVS